MATKQLATLAALWCCATPSLAFDTRDAGPSALFYIEFPLDAATRKQRELNFGFSVQGREYRALNFDTRILNALEAAGLGVEAKWIGGGGAVLLMLLARGKSGGGGGGSTQQAAATPPAGATTPPVVDIPGGGGTGGGGTGGGGTGGGGTGGGGTGGGTCTPCGIGTCC